MSKANRSMTNMRGGEGDMTFTEILDERII